MVNDLQGYKTVHVYKSIDDPKLIYVSKSLHFLNKFFINRFNGDTSKFIYEGEMMVKLRRYYIQTYHGVYKRIYKNEIEEKPRVKLNKNWSYSNFDGINKRKLQQVIIGWKHTEIIKTDSTTHKNQKHPKISYEGDELKGKGRWSNIKWLRQAVIDYIEYSGYDPKKIDETFVKRIY